MYKRYPTNIHDKSHIQMVCHKYKRDYILQKRPIIWRSLLVIAILYATNIHEKSHIQMVCHKYKKDYILQKRPIIWRSLLVIAIPYATNIHEKSHMGWLQVVGSLELYVSFAEYRLFYMALLQKRPMILRSLPIVATPYWNESCTRCEYECAKPHTWSDYICV